MSETPAEEKQEAAASDSGGAEQSANSSDVSDSDNKPVKRPASGAWFVFLFLVILIGAAGGGYWYYLHPQVIEARDQLSDLDQELESVAGRLEEEGSALTSLESRLNQQQSQMPELRSALVALGNEMASLADRVREVESSRSGDWVVAEAQYLVRLANQKLLIGTDIDTAVELLSDADELLFDLGYPEARNAREALAADILRLERVSTVDYQGIYFRLSGLIALAAELPMPEIASLEAAASAAEDEEATGWRRWWQALVQRLTPLFVVRRDETDSRLLTNQQIELQKLRIQILLHEAQLGLMSAEPEIYRASLDQARQLSLDFFADSDEAQALARQIEALANRNVSVEAPEITASLRAMDDLSEFLRNTGGGN